MMYNYGVYNLVNANNGKYANVHMGYDTDDTNVYQWTSDGSMEQKFKLVYDSSQDAYRIYVMCSSNGNNRVLDIVKSGGSVVSGANVQIYRPVDNVAQLWIITLLSNGKYAIRPKSNTSVALTAYGTSNGTSGGKSSTSAGNIFLSPIVNNSVNASQQWTLNLVSNSSEWGYMFNNSRMAKHISSPYGLRYLEDEDKWDDHFGIDITTGRSGEISGYPVYSALGGSVIKNGYFTDGVTTCVAITSSNGYTARYIHMSLLSNGLSSTIGKGVLIGYASNEGTKGPHLHFDVNTINTINGPSLTYNNTVDPVELFPNIAFTY